MRFLLISLVLPLAARAGWTQQVPVLQGTALSGEKVDFPEVFRSHLTVLVVSFSQAARENVSAWYRRMDADFKASATVLYFEVPIIAGAPGFLRGTIVKKIKQDVAASAQPHFVPVLDHEEAWKLASGWSKQMPDDYAYVLLVDGAGRIQAHAAYAAPTDQSYADLKRQLAVLRP